MRAHEIWAHLLSARSRVVGQHGVWSVHLKGIFWAEKRLFNAVLVEHVSMKHTAEKPISENSPLSWMVLASPSRQGPGRGLRMRTFLPANGSNRMKCTQSL